MVWLYKTKILRHGKNYVIPSKRINVESTLKQRWSSTFINVVSTLIFGWKGKLSGRSFIDVVSRLAKQRWNNVDRITSMQRLWTKVVSTLKFGWEWKLNRRMFIYVVSTLTKQRWNNDERITSTQYWFNVVSTLIFGWKGKLSQRMFIGVEKTALKQFCQYLLYWCSLESGSIAKQNYVFKYKSYICFI